MDQLAPVFQWLKRNGFWIVSTLVALLLVGGWYLASTQIEAQRADAVRKLKSSFSEMASVRKVSAVSSEDGAETNIVAHPNSVTEEKMTQELKETIDAITEVWTQKRTEQETLLVFPKDILGEKTFEYFNQGKTAEDFANGTVVSATEKTYLRTYREQIPRQVAKIARHLKAYWKFDPKLIEEELMARAEMEKMGKSFGSRMGPGKDMVDTKRNKYAVIWNESNQNLWQRKMIEFRDWDDNSGSTQDPTILQAYVLQQDIWLLEAMFNVIRKVNGEAITNDLAVIKEIDYLAFGREARSKLGELAQADKRLGGAEVPLVGEGGMGGMASSMASSMSSSRGGGGFGDEEGEGVFDLNADPCPFHGRYVSSDQEALSAETVRATINGEDELPEQHLELIVAKRVPFRLAVNMDERTVLAFKGGVDKRKAVAVESGGISAMGSMMNGMLGGEDGMARAFEQQKLDVLRSTPVETRLNYDVRVEFYGIVRIYNPVKKDYLLRAVGLPEENPTEDEEPVADGVAVVDRKL